jgi:hypothetical protein
MFTHQMVPVRMMLIDEEGIIIIMVVITKQNICFTFQWFRCDILTGEYGA